MTKDEVFTILKRMTDPQTIYKELYKMTNEADEEVQNARREKPATDVISGDISGASDES